ncbi:MAG: formylglycine-generating enzyme family protein [Planctomycetota bacterium]
MARIPSTSPFPIMAFILALANCASADLPQEFTNSLGMKLRLIPAGEFMMGSSCSAEELAEVFPHTDAESFEDERPRHRVRITEPFYVGITEVTQEQYVQVMGTNPSQFQGEKRPVDTVTWDDAVEFCKRLSAKEERAYRLPTEAEWEYACRAGTATRWYFGDRLTSTGERENEMESPALERMEDGTGLFRDDNASSGEEGNTRSADHIGARLEEDGNSSSEEKGGSEQEDRDSNGLDEDDELDGMHETRARHLEQHAWYAPNSDMTTHPVAQKEPNPWGLHDLYGNVWEWCSDWYAASYYANSPVDDPTGPESGTGRVTRGGSWLGATWGCRSSLRSKSAPNDELSHVGFRVVAEPTVNQQ